MLTGKIISHPDRIPGLANPSRDNLLVLIQIERFQSKFIEEIRLETESHHVIFIGEVRSFYKTEHGVQLNQDFANATKQFLEIKIKKSQDLEIEIRRSAMPGVPIYVSLEDGIFAISWRFEEAVENIKIPRANVEVARLYVEHGPPLTRETVISNVFMLWPGEHLTVKNGALHFSEYDPGGIVTPSTLHYDAPVTDALKEIIGSNIQDVLDRSIIPMIELSGGFDSGCVAICAASVRENLSSYGLVHPGVVGEQQRSRRNEFVKLLALNDHEFPSDRHMQLASLEIPEAQLTPFDDNQRIPCSYGVDTHPAGLADLLLTGVGGDELCMEHTYRRWPWEVNGHGSRSALTTAAGRADMFLRRGIWPVNPLCAPNVIDFCRALPTTVRKNRQLNMLMLARAGLSDGYLFPRFAEGYGHAMQREAALFDFDSALRDSMVSDLGLIDLSALLSQAHEASEGGYSYKLIVKLFLLLKLEKVYSRYLTN